MVSINLFVEETDDYESVLKKVSKDFIIHHTSSYNKSNIRYFFIIETTEEEYTFLRLKYGKENVWLR